MAIKVDFDPVPGVFLHPHVLISNDDGRMTWQFFYFIVDSYVITLRVNIIIIHSITQTHIKTHTNEAQTLNYGDGHFLISPIYFLILEFVFVCFLARIDFVHTSV